MALIAGPLGCFMVWRRMAYFGAALSHAALLGVALGFVLGVNPTIGIAALSVVVTILVVVMEHRPYNAHTGRSDALFDMFECEDDPATAAALVGAADPLAV